MKKTRRNSQKTHMVPKILFTVLSIFLLLAAFSVFDNAIATAHITPGKDKAMSSNPTDIAELPCIPGWAKRFTAPVEGTNIGPAVQVQPFPKYQLLTEVQITEDVFCTHFDKENSLTKIYVGDYANNRVMVLNITKNLIGYSQILDIPYGMAWLIEDLDRDGNVELVIQRGDPGFGGNGYLDIHSAPSWELRTRIVLQDMKIYFYPLAVNVDNDPYLELYLSPASLWGFERAMVVQYDPINNTFVVTDNLLAPTFHYGQSAAADFDADGQIEIITGNDDGYGLFEYGGGGTTSEYYGLHYKGLISGAIPGHWAISLRPKPDNLPYALLGSSSFEIGYTYQLLKSSGDDNAFEIVESFNQDTGYAGIHPSYAIDDDKDGLDEICMGFHPYRKVYEWSTFSGGFVHTWTWDEIAQGTFVGFAGTDVDQDGYNEWCMVNHLNILKFFERQLLVAREY
jgi:hypothetical protein